jgi:hypothetical protein
MQLLQFSDADTAVYTCIEEVTRIQITREIKMRTLGRGSGHVVCPRGLLSNPSFGEKTKGKRNKSPFL